MPTCNRLSCHCESVIDGIREMKIDYAKGYRVYFEESDGKIVISNILTNLNMMNFK